MTVDKQLISNQNKTPELEKRSLFHSDTHTHTHMNARTHTRTHARALSVFPCCKALPELFGDLLSLMWNLYLECHTELWQKVKDTHTHERTHLHTHTHTRPHAARRQ